MEEVGALGLETSATSINAAWASRVSLLRRQAVKKERGKEREPLYLLFSLPFRSNSQSVLYPSYYTEEETEIQVAGEQGRSPARVFRLPWQFEFSSLNQYWNFDP